ncbi:hypothetical protein I4U23_014617 [Adineta vaga]|nr:hypothetical protein I4U23_014617 [Adineta vaga]
MLKAIVFTIFLVASPSFGLIDSLFRAQNDCYSGCRSTYALSSSNIFSCQSGCNYKLQNENCVDQCRLFTVEEQKQASCLVGCSTNQVNLDDRSPRITVVRIHTPMEISNEKTKPILQSVSDRFKKIIELTKNFYPLSSNDANQESIKHFIVLHGTKLESTKNQIHQYADQLNGYWNEFIHKQSKVAIWFFLGLCFFSCALLWCMIVSLCRHRPTSQGLSIRAQELAFDNNYEKEKIQPNEYYHDATQVAPIHVKLTHI